MEQQFQKEIEMKATLKIIFSVTLATVCLVGLVAATTDQADAAGFLPPCPALSAMKPEGEAPIGQCSIDGGACGNEPCDVYHDAATGWDYYDSECFVLPWCD